LAGGGLNPFLARSLAFLKAHWGPAAAGALVVLAFVWGRHSLSGKVETRTVEHTSFVDRVVTVHEAAEVHVQEHVVFRDRTVIKKADGSEEHRDIERTDAADTTARATVTAEDRVVFRDREVVREKRVDAPLNWHVSALVGAGVSLKPFGLGPLVYGASVERRVLGPVVVGVWGLSSAAGGITVGVAF
jgi:hypothetical protein